MADTPKTIHVTVDMDTDEVRNALLKAKADGWNEGATHAWAASNDCGHNGEAAPGDAPLEDNPYQAALARTQENQ